MYIQMFSLNKKDPVSALTGTICVTTAVLAVLTAVALLWPFEELPKHRSLDMIIKLALSGLFAAVIEEYFFRGWLQPLFKERMPALYAIIVVNLIFAPLHLLAVCHPISLAVFFPGMIMGLLKENYGYIWSPILFHFLGNIWAIWFFPAPF